MRSRSHPDAPGRCPRCWLLSSWCACALLVPHPVATRFVVIRHRSEQTKSTGTVRWARLLMPRCELLDYAARADGAGLPVCLPGDWLLFPAAPGAVPPPAGAPERVVVLDGTWRQARRMLRAVPALASLPRLALPQRLDGARLRAAPRSGALSTLEAMAGAVGLLEGDALGEALLRTHDLLVDRVLRSRGRPGVERAA